MKRIRDQKKIKIEIKMQEEFKESEREIDSFVPFPTYIYECKTRGHGNTEQKREAANIARSKNSKTLLIA